MMRERVARSAKPSGSFAVSAGRQTCRFCDTLLSYTRPVLRRTGRGFVPAYSERVQRVAQPRGGAVSCKPCTDGLQ